MLIFLSLINKIINSYYNGENAKFSNAKFNTVIYLRCF